METQHHRIARCILSDVISPVFDTTPTPDERTRQTTMNSPAHTSPTGARTRVRHWGRRLAGAALALVTASTLAACTSSIGEAESTASASSTAFSTPVTLGLTYIPNVQFAPAYVAEKEGAFADHGVDVTIRHHGSDEGLFTALLAGEENLVIASGDEMLQARSTGMDLMSVGSYYATYPVRVIVPKDSPITSIADLKGKTVGLPGEYGSNWFGLLAALSSAGMTTSDITVSSIGYTQLAALQAKQVDAVVGFTNNDTVQFTRAGLEVREIPLVASGDAPLVGANLVTTRDYANTHADAVRGVIAALTEGMQRSVDDPDAAISATAQYDPQLSANEDAARATLAATATLWAPQGRASMMQNLDTWQAMGTFLAGIDGILGASVTVSDAVTNDFVK